MAHRTLVLDEDPMLAWRPVHHQGSSVRNRCSVFIYVDDGEGDFGGFDLGAKVVANEEGQVLWMTELVDGEPE